jgi:PqqD family protein of HPr-rel-A system
MVVERFPCRRADVVYQSAGEETLLYDPLADAVHVLNPTALAVWELCDGQHTLADIEAYLRVHFGDPVGQDVAGDVEAVLDTFEKEGLVNRG